MKAPTHQRNAPAQIRIRPGNSVPTTHCPNPPSCGLAGAVRICRTITSAPAPISGSGEDNAMRIGHSLLWLPPCSAMPPSAPRRGATAGRCKSARGRYSTFDATFKSADAEIEARNSRPGESPLRSDVDRPKFIAQASSRKGAASRLPHGSASLGTCKAGSPAARCL